MEGEFLRFIWNGQLVSISYNIAHEKLQNEKYICIE